MTAVDVTAEAERELEEQLSHPDIDAAVPPADEELAGPKVYVCDRLTAEGAPCGESFSEADYADRPEPRQAAAAKYAAHVRFEHPKDGSAPTKERRAAKRARDRAPAREATAAAPSSAPASRADQYAVGLSSIALALWLAPGGFDEFDLDAVNKGAPMIGEHLGAIADKHAIVREVADLVLGAGAGSPYASLVLACLAVGAPIAAHHGWIPSSAGERFGALIGVTTIPGVAPAADAPVPTGAEEENTGAAPTFGVPETADDVIEYLAAAPGHVMVDVGRRMMGEDNATAAYAPPDISLVDEREPAPA